MSWSFFVCFFFQAEDGIRDDLVTGVQTCALPICAGSGERAADPLRAGGDAPPRDGRLVPPRGRGPGGGDGARQHGGDQEARRGGAGALDHVVVWGGGGGAAAEARGGATRPAALPGDRRHPPTRQAADAGARGVPGDARGPPPVARVGRGAGGRGRGPSPTPRA